VTTTHYRVFSLEFLHDMVHWSIYMALCVGVVGVLLTSSWSFVLSFALGAAVDVGILKLAVARGERLSGGDADAGMQAASVLMALRLLVKALLVLAAVMLPAFLDVWGMALGVLVVDVTIFTVGSVKALRAV